MVNKTKGKYQKLNKAFNEFGAPSISESEFLGTVFWGIGREPNRIEIMNEIKGLTFDASYEEGTIYQQENLKIRYIHFNDLLDSKKAAGRFKD